MAPPHKLKVFLAAAMAPWTTGLTSSMIFRSCGTLAFPPLNVHAEFLTDGMIEVNKILKANFSTSVSRKVSRYLIHVFNNGLRKEIPLRHARVSLHGHVSLTSSAKAAYYSDNTNRIQNYLLHKLVFASNPVWPLVIGINLFPIRIN